MVHPSVAIAILGYDLVEQGGLGLVMVAATVTLELASLLRANQVLLNKVLVLLGLLLVKDLQITVELLALTSGR